MINTSKVFSEKAMRLCEIVGVGPKLTLAILSEMLDVSCFENAEQYAAFAGVTPCQFQSGTSVRRRPSMSRLGSRSIRKTLFMSALVVKNYNRYFANWIAKLEKKGKKPKVIIVAVMRKLLHIIYEMLKNNARFNPELAFAVIKNKQ
jgi:transposase